MCSLVMNLCSRDLLMTSLNILLTIHCNTVVNLHSAWFLVNLLIGVLGTWYLKY